MQTIICLVGAIVPFVVALVICACLRAPLGRFLRQYLDESVANMAFLFICLVALFYAVRVSADSLAGLRAGIGRFVSGVVGPGLSACDSILSFLMGVLNVVALLSIGHAILKSGVFAPRPDSGTRASSSGRTD